MIIIYYVFKLSKFMKDLLKIFLLCSLQVFNIGEVFSTEQNCTESKKCHSKNISSNNIDLDTKFDESFNRYSSFEEVIKPKNQFKNLFGIDGFQEQRLKRSAFKLWDIYEKESSKQIGNKRLDGSDINNTFNQTLKDL